MRNITKLLFLGIALSLALNGCRPNPSPVISLSAYATTSTPPTPTTFLSTPTITLIPKGKAIVVVSADDSGAGTLRQAMLDAKPGNTITFDPKVFPPDNPTTIFLKTQEQEGIALPEFTQGYLTIDASDAGVILDGRDVQGEWVNCLSIRSNGNVIRGLQIVNFPGGGIGIMGGAKNNIIGGDRNLGLGPLGQGNLTSGNRTGIDLQDEDTSFNTVLGNLVGTDVNGLSARGNKDQEDTGIYIANGASHNTIGPGNVIAYNSAGIQIYKPDSLGNTITQNSIYDNGWIGILLMGNGNASLESPSIIGYNLTTGSITVFTCARCTVEIYSDKNGQGEVYEIQGTADDTGILTLDKGAPFKGPNLTAIATDEDGNTSRFSLPTTEINQPLLDVVASNVVQDGNNLPRIDLISKSSAQLEDNRMGTFTGGMWHPMYEPEVYPDATLDPNYILEMGFKRFRFAINHLDPDKIDWTKPDLLIDPSQDDFIASLANNGVKLTYVLTFWDTSYKANGGEIPAPRFRTEEEIQRYLKYVKFSVNHFKDRVEYYEIWNEPNRPEDLKYIEVDDYIELVKRTVPVIRQEYPEAKIIIGGISTFVEPGSRDYLFRLLNSDFMPLVDVISWHPMIGTSPAYEEQMQYYYEYPSLVQEIKEVAVAHGFKGEFEADEIHWPIPPQPEPPSPAYSNIQSVKYLTRSILTHLGMDVTVTQLLLVDNPQLYRTNAYLSTVMAGNKTINLPATIQSEAKYVKSYGFSLPNGDNLLAVWNDGSAVDYDTGIPFTLTIPDFANWNATGIDVLNGFEQKLITNSENGDLIIHDFLLKDYPIIIRLSK